MIWFYASVALLAVFSGLIVVRRRNRRHREQNLALLNRFYPERTVDMVGKLTVRGNTRIIEWTGYDAPYWSRTGKSDPTIRVTLASARNWQDSDGVFRMEMLPAGISSIPGEAFDRIWTAYVEKIKKGAG